MKIFNGINFKILLSISFILIGFFSLFFITNTKVLAQTEDDIVVETLGYSQVSLTDPTEVIFNGAYYNYFGTSRGFTTYFQFKESDSNLDDGAETTIEIVRKATDNIEESNDFYSSPEVSLLKVYYFRAVGCFEENPIIGEGCKNDSSAKKFYGDTLHFDTGKIIGATIPYFVDNNNVVVNSPTCHNRAVGYPVCKVDINGDCVNGATNPPTCTIDRMKCSNGATDFPNCLVGSDGNCLNKKYNNPPDCKAVCTDNKAKNYPKCTTDIDGNCLNQKANPPECTTGSIIIDTGGGLVKCGTLFYEKGHTINGVDVGGMVTEENKCGFNDVLTLINDVIKFILFKMVIPIAAIMFAYAGFELLTSGGETSKRQKAKKIFTDVAIGLVIAAAAFLIVNAVLLIVGAKTDIDWFGFLK